MLNQIKTENIKKKFPELVIFEESITTGRRFQKNGETFYIICTDKISRFSAIALK